MCTVASVLKHRAMKACIHRGVYVRLHILTSALERGECLDIQSSTSAMEPLVPLGECWLSGLQRRSGRGGEEKKKPLPVLGI
jgi:hypothetical protein